MCVCVCVCVCVCARVCATSEWHKQVHKSFVVEPGALNSDLSQWLDTSLNHWPLGARHITYSRAPREGERERSRTPCQT